MSRNTLPIHCEFSITYNRFTLMQRSLQLFLNQDYEGRAVLLIFNTGVKFELGDFEIPKNREIILINDQETDFGSVGEKYNKAITYLPDYVDTINFKDEDDMTYKNHISLGVDGLIRGKKSAYKPEKSWFHYQGNLTQESNVMEGSIFMKADHIRKHKFGSGLSVKYHDKWLHPLIENNNIFVDPQGESTFIYDWGTPVPCYKMSGRLESDENYQISKIEARDTGNGILVPSSEHIIKGLE